MYSKKLLQNDYLDKRLKTEIFQHSKQTFMQHDAALKGNGELAYMLLNDSRSPLTAHNSVKLLINGENKFPEVLRALSSARHHIHLEYYIFEEDEIGKAIGEVLIQKAREGVDVRFIYDDFGSHSIRRKFCRELEAGGVKVYPFFKVYFYLLANRLNYRNHRKIIVVDGNTAFVGGINVSDRYINDPGYPDRVYWRDTHLRIDGPGVHYLQYLFLCDWNFCTDEQLQPDESFFPEIQNGAGDDKVIQIAASGPDSETPTILFSILQAINLATREILITTPYFIPGESLLDALIVASLSGISIKLLVPGVSDSWLVNFAARSYYAVLLKAGVEIYRYKKGFIHGKTLVADGNIAIVGTANMDFRSFDLNFEVNAIIYNSDLAGELRTVFNWDLKNAEKIDAMTWKDRVWYKQLLEKTARLLSPLL